MSNASANVANVATGAFAIAGVSTPEVGTRYGMKGARAAQWLAQQGIAVPATPNHVTQWTGAGGGRCLRLGNTEFLVEHDAGSSLPAQPAGDGAWLLLRSDASLLFDGAAWPDALAQVCSFDFRRFHDEPDLVVMTLLAGISVTLVREPRAGNDIPLALRLWCDASYSTYLQHCLQHLARPDTSSGEQR